MAKKRSPNILLMFSDQLRHDALGCSGNRFARTPRIDRLAAEGLSFSNAVTPTPVCVPARMSLITGLRGSRTGFVNNGKLPGPLPAHPTIMTLLHEAGYETKGVGKMHFERRHHGLQSCETQEECPDHIIDDDYLLYLRSVGLRTRFPLGYRNLLYFQPQTSALPTEHSPEHWVAARSMEFLRNHARYRPEKPFFLWSSWIAPHPPFAACEPYDSLFDPERLPPPVYPERPLADLPYPAREHRARLDGAGGDPARMRRIRALYHGQVAHVDDCVGMILDQLDALGLREDTIVIFASDHGDMLGDHGLSQKNVPYEAAVRIPLLIRWPGRIAPGSRSEELASLTDILPTLASSLGLELPASDAVPVGADLLDPAGFSRDRFIVDYGSGLDRWISVRTKKHMYALWAAGGREELYDIDQDPEERNNLISAAPALAEEFRGIALAWEREQGLADSFAGGEFRTFPVPEAPEESSCRAVVINQGRWAENLPADEGGLVESFQEAFDAAVSKETELGPEDLSVDQFAAKGGSLAGTVWERECEPRRTGE
jgi:arylsulfatase A-like enzyme